MTSSEGLEMGSNKQSLTMTACVAGNDRQLFFFDGPQLLGLHRRIGFQHFTVNHAMLLLAELRACSDKTRG